MDALQRELREVPGVSVLIYEQACATEKRRRRKRGTMEDPALRGHQRAGLRGLRRLFGRLQLPVGRADRDRVRHQAPHQPVDLQQGFLLPRRLLPELRHGGRRGAPEEDGRGIRSGGPCRRSSRAGEAGAGRESYDLLITGVGGTGVITVGQLVTMAAHLEAKGASVLDFTGFAQKFGPVLSYVRLAPTPRASTRCASTGARPTR
jgi:indolepyruvate ferredoxin oxidoreductase